MEQWIEYKLTVLVTTTPHQQSPACQSQTSMHDGIYAPRTHVVTSTRLCQRLCTVDDRAETRTWNSLLDFATSESSLPTFKRRLNTVLLATSYPSLCSLVLYARSVFLHCTSVFTFLLLLFCKLS